MNARSLGDIAASIVGRRKCRTDAENPTDPVLAHSYDIDDPRAKPWKPIGNGSTAHGWAFTDALTATLEDAVAEHRRTRFEGPHRLQWTYPQVLRALLSFLNYRTGELWASYETIAVKAAVSRTTAIEAIEALEHHGFLAHVRRSERVPEAEGQARPQRKQAPNAYLFDCERRMAADLWGRFWKRVTVNVTRLRDAAQRRTGELLRSFNPAALTPPRRTDGPLMAALASLGRSIEGAASTVSASP